MFDWYCDLSKPERRTFTAAFAGWSVDAFDFTVYTFLIPTLIAAWSMTKAEAGLIATASLILSAVVGWAAGILADRFGRVRVLQITIVWFSLFTFLSGFTTSFEQLLVTRALQGLGFGGEWAVGSVLVGEMIRAQHRGNRRPASGVGHGEDVDLCVEREQMRREVGKRADARRRHAVVARVLPYLGNQLGHGFHRLAGVRDEHMG